MVNVMSQMQKMIHERPQGALPSNTKPNLREQVNSIMTRSGLITVEPSLPSPILPNPREEGEKELETLMDEVHITSPVLEQLEDPGKIGPLKPTRMTLELANRSVTYLMGIAEFVIVKVEKFKFLVDFIIIDFEADPRVPIILGRPFSRTSKALVDLYEEKLTLRVRNEEVVFYTDKSSRNNLRDIQ
ncbi:reverse transcriptase domain-containing protein, partial [Tanacetum coccineum]